MEQEVVVVGAGHAGGECAAALRMAGHSGPITVVGQEKFLPYQRPPLSKEYFSGGCEVRDLLLRPQSFYDKYEITVLLGRSVAAVRRAEHTVQLDDGAGLAYGSLVLATGGRPRVLPAAELRTARSVFYVRTIADVDRMRDSFQPGKRLVVIGGGYVGLEVAAVARRMQLGVTIVESAPRLLARVTSPEVSGFFARIHAEEGADVRVGAVITGFRLREDGDIAAVQLDGQGDVLADLVVVGVGMMPNVELAERSGLDVRDGIVIDELCRTSDPDILAIGDCTFHPCRERGGFRRLESVPNAAEQARVAADVITGKPPAAPGVPWFWSDQYDVKLQVTGLSSPGDEVVIRGSNQAGRSFAAFYLRDGLVRSAAVISDPRTFAAAKKLVAGRARVDPALIADTSRPLKDLLPPHR